MENSFKGKKVLFMGDSITALYMGERGWPRYFCSKLEVAKHACVAVAGARWCDAEDTVYDGNPVFIPNADRNPNNTMCNQMEKVMRQKAAGNEDFADFDVIILAAGSNDASPDTPEVSDAQFFADGEYVPLEKANTRTWAGAIRYVSEHLYELYPNAIQFICGPIQADDKVRPFRSILGKGYFLKEIAARLSVGFVDTVHCGVYGRYEKWGSNGRCLVDGLHPNVNGAKLMGEYIAMCIKPYLE